MIRIEIIHPMIVHFGIALLIVSFLAYLLGLFVKSEAIASVFKWNLILGIIATAAAVAVGIKAASLAPHTEASHEIIEHFHEPLGKLTLAIVLVLGAWGMIARWKFGGLLRFLYLIVFAAAMASLAATGYYGGKLVYEHGVGINSKLLKPSLHVHHHDEEEEGEEHHHHAHESGQHDEEKEEAEHHHHEHESGDHNKGQEQHEQ